MSPGARLVRALRRWVQRACVAATLLVVVAPAALGPALGPALEQLGAAGKHACRCGMDRGKCGCPACAKLEHQRLSEHVPDPVPVLKRQCAQGAPGMAFAALPMVAVAFTSSPLPIPPGPRTHVGASPLAPRVRLLEPPTPPPRLAAV